MKRISFNPRFVNEAGNDLIPGKIHTIRQNFDFWKRFVGQEVALFTWEGKPYQKGSKQKIFCTKRITGIQTVIFGNGVFWENRGEHLQIDTHKIARNDGFKDIAELKEWFKSGNYMPGKMAIIHFTDFRY